MIDANRLFQEGWAKALSERAKQSPSFKLEGYTVTGRTAAKWGGKRTAAWWTGEEGGPAMVQRWIDWRRKTRWEIWETPEGNPGIELELNITLPGDIPVKMFIDRLFVTPTGEMVVVDIKSGARTPETPEQLGLYATGIELTWGSHYRPTWGYWWDANKGEHSTPLDLSMYTAQYLANLYEDAIAGINAGSFLPTVQNGCPNWCSVADYCAAAGGVKAAGVDPLLSA